MEGNSLTVVLWSHLLATAANAAFAFKLYTDRRERPADPAASLLLAAAVAGALWGVLVAAFSRTTHPSLLAAAELLDVARYGAWYAFLLTLGRARTGEAGGNARRTLHPLAGVAASVFAAGVAIHGWQAVFPGSYARLVEVAWLHSLIMVVVALMLLEQLFRGVAADGIWHVKPLGMGLAGAFLFDLYLSADAVLFRNPDVNTFAARGFVHAIVVPLLWVSSTRTRDWLAKVRLSQKAAFHTASLVFVGGYLLFMASVGYYVRSFGGAWSHALLVAVIFAMLLLLAIFLFSASTRARMRVFVGKHFFSYRYDYREEWLRFTQVLSAQGAPEGMGQQVIRGLANLVESPAGSLWLKNPARAHFQQTAAWNTPVCADVEPADGSLCRFLQSSGWVVNLEEYRSFPGRYGELKLPGWVAQVPNAWLIVPLTMGSELTGFAILCSARTDIEVNWEVNDLLRTAGRQAATFLAQMQATEALLETRKFDAFNRMSAFVVHDLKNIVTQLSLLVKNAERHGDNPEFQADMRMTVAHSVERMRQLMMQLREGATPPGTPVGVDLAVIIERIARAKAAQGRNLDSHIDDRLMTRGHEERIERVIGHLVQNAIDATETKGAEGAVDVRLLRNRGWAQIEITDNGQGMTQEFIRERLFKPFQTTKQAGMGIGAYESFQYVQELGGKVEVQSAPGQGTRIALQLPVFEGGPSEAQAQADRPAREAA